MMDVILRSELTSFVVSNPPTPFFSRFNIFIIKINIMAKTVRLTESDLTRIVKRVIKEDEDEDTTEYMDCLDCLKKVNNRINRRELIRWFNDNDVDYYNMSDLDMYIYYIENK